MHDLFGNALDFDVHLQSSDAVGGTGHFKVHVAQMIFVAQDIGQDRKATGIFDEAHGNTGHVSFHGYTCVHQGQTATAHRSHGRRTIGLCDFGHHAHGVRKLFFGRQDRSQSTLGQPAVTNFTTLCRTHAAHFACGKGRHVVVQHEAVFVFAGQGVNALCIALGAQSGDHQSLCFAACEQA